MIREQKEIIELTKKLMRFKTTYDNPTELERCMDYIEGYFSDCDVKIRRFDNRGKPSLVVSLSGKRDPELFLVGHIDVVPADDKLFTPKLKGGKIYGRGSYDDKSSVAIMMVLMKHYSRHYESPDFAIMITGDEETSGKAGAQFLLKTFTSQFAVVLDGGTGYEIITKEKGALHVLVKAHGKNAHGSTPWEGENAVDKLITFYQRLKKQFPPTPRSGKQWKNTMSLGTIKGGHAANQVPEYAEMGIDMRFVNDLDKNKVLRFIEFYPGIEFEIMTDAKFLDTDARNKHVLALKKSAKRVLKRQARLGKEEGASDARYFADKDIPSILLWPEGGHAHSENEYVEIASLWKIYLLLHDFINTGISKK